MPLDSLRSLGTGPHPSPRSLGTGPPTPRQQVTAAGLLTAAAGLGLFAWLVWTVGPGEIWAAFQRVGWGIGWIVALGGLRFAARAAAWAMCVEPPHRLRFTDAFLAVVCGDALGNLTPLGPIVGEPAKVACVRRQVPIGVAFTALAIENVIYSMSVAAMIAAGTIALLLSVDLPLRLREFSEAAVAGIAALFVIAALVVWRRPTLLGPRGPAASSRGTTSKARARLERLRAIEQDVYTFASRRRGVMVPVVVAELAFHALGVAEKHLTLWLILPAPPPLLYSFIVETADRLITVAFKFVPFQVGVGEAGTGIVTELLGMGTLPGVTLQIVRKARMGIWSLAGMALLVRRGLTARRILEDTELGQVR